MSNIDPTVPTYATATTQSVRDNFGIAKTEIEALQAAMDALPFAADGTLDGPLIYTATGGTTPRSAQDRAADIVQVADYNSLQAAIDALPATGGTVTLAANTVYALTAGVSTAKPNVTLSAPGWGTIIRRDPSFTTGILVNLTGAGSIIENMTVDGNNVIPTNYTGYSEVAVGGANSVARNCQIINSKGTVHLTLAGANAKALFNTITGPGIDLGLETGYGIWAINGDTVLIEGNKITGTCIDGIGFDGPGSRVINNRVSGCHCYVSNGGGQIAYYSTHGTRMVMIGHNHVGSGGGASADGIELSGQYCAVIGNTVDSVGGIGIHITPNSGKVVVANGIILNCGTGAPGLTDGINIAPNVSDVAIHGMRITDTQTTKTMRDAINVGAGTGGNLMFTNNVLAPNGHLAISDAGTGPGRIIANNFGVDDVYVIVPTAGTITLPTNPMVIMSGAGTVTAIAPGSGCWEGRQFIIYAGGVTVTFTAGATIANTVTLTPEVPHTALWVGGKLHIGA